MEERPHRRYSSYTLGSSRARVARQHFTPTPKQLSSFFGANGRGQYRVHRLDNSTTDTLAAPGPSRPVPGSIRCIDTRPRATSEASTMLALNRPPQGPTDSPLTGILTRSSKTCRGTRAPTSPSTIYFPGMSIAKDSSALPDGVKWVLMLSRCLKNRPA